MLNTKRKHKTLTLAVKAEILSKLDEGKQMCELARYYNIGRSTIHDLRKNRHKIENYLKSVECGAGQRKTLKWSKYPRVEQALYEWYLEERQQSTVTGEKLQEKAKILYKEIMSKDDFKASDGWLDKFKKRYGIRFLTSPSPTPSSSINLVKVFIMKFEERVKELGLTPDQVYNAEESGLFWKWTPQNQSSAANKDRITFMPCANASGTHKLKLLVVGKTEHPNVSIPVTYKTQNKYWMTMELFHEWFHNEFVPAVTSFQEKHNLPQGALLVLDNAHPSDQDLVSSDGKIRTMRLPQNITPELQPMNHNVIPMMKSQYKKKYLMQSMSQDDDVTLTDGVFMLAETWQSVPSNTIVASWKELWGSQTPNNLEGALKIEDDIGMEDVVAALTECKTELNSDDLNEWLQGVDENLFMDDESDGMEIKVEDESDFSLMAKLEELNDVIGSFSKCVKWAEENGVSSEEIMVMRKLRETVVKKTIIIKNQYRR